MTRSKPVQKFIVWHDSDPSFRGQYHAPDPETAAEWHALEDVDGQLDGLYSVGTELNVQAEDGTVYGVFVETVTAVNARPS